MSLQRLLVIDGSGATSPALSTSQSHPRVLIATVSQLREAEDLMRTEIFDAVVTDMIGFRSAELMPVLAAARRSPGLIVVGQMERGGVERAALSRSIDLLAVLDPPASLDDILPLLSSQNPLGKGTLSDAEFVKGLMGDALQPIYQPILNIGTNQIDEVEVLARWQRPGGALYGASAILTMARAGGHMNILTERVMECAFSEQVELRARGHDLVFGINITLENLSRRDFVDMTLDLAREHAVKPDRVRLSVSDSVLAQMTAKMEDSLRRLKKAGFWLTLDDYAGRFTALVEFDPPLFDELVIARHITRLASGSEAGKKALGSAIVLAHALGMRAICEGIEDDTQRSLVTELEADGAIGYGIGLPMTRSALEKWLEG